MRSIALPLGLALFSAACATTPGGVAEAERDRYENVNRAIYKFNKGLDTAIIKPTTTIYRAAVPAAARRGASNALDNVDEPLSFINALLQGKVKSAFRAADRFLINSTLGVGGLADHATDMGLPKQEEDFGQTLAAWGIGSGPYIMLPLLGPSTLRDTVGFGAVEEMVTFVTLAHFAGSMVAAKNWSLNGRGSVGSGTTVRHPRVAA